MAILKERLALLIDADTKGAVRGLNQVGQSARTNLGGTQTMVSQFTDSLRQSAPVIGAALGAAGYAFVQVTDSASRLSSANGALQASFRGMTTGVQEFTRDAEGLGLSEAAAAESAARLGGGLQALGFTTGEAAGEVKTLIERAADMSVGFGTTEEALSAISALLRGERDPIEQYGVAIKEADVKARLAADGLDHLTGEALKNAQAVASLELFYEATANRMGLYGSEANAAAREQAELTAKFENLQAEIGTALLPALVDLASGMNTAIDVGRVLAAVIGDVASSAAAAVPDVSDLLTALPSWAQGAADALGPVGDALGDLLGPSNSDIELIPPEEFERIQRGTAQAATSWLGLGDAVSSVSRLIGDAASGTDEADRGLSEVADKYESIFSELFAYQDALQGVEDGTRQVADAHRAHADAQREAADAADDVRQAALDVAEAMVLQFDATDAARKGIDDYAAAQAAATDPIFAMIRALEQQDELLKQAKGSDVKKDGTKLSASGSAPTLLDFAEGAAGVQQAAIGLAGALRTGQTSIGQVQDALKGWVAQGLITEDQAHALGVMFAEAAGKASELEGANVAGAAAAGVAAGKLEAEEEAAERTRAAQDRLRAAQERLTASQDRVADTAGDVARAHEDATRKAWALDQAQFELNAKIEKNPGLIEDAKRKMREWVDQGLVPAATAARDLRDMLGGINDQLERRATIRDTVLNLADAFNPWSGATGGRVPGPMGQEVPILAHGGEMVVSNTDLSRMRQGGSSAYSGPLMVVENITATDVGTAIRQAGDELVAVQYRAGLN